MLQQWKTVLRKMDFIEANTSVSSSSSCIFIKNSWGTAPHHILQSNANSIRWSLTLKCSESSQEKNPSSAERELRWTQEKAVNDRAPQAAGEGAVPVAGRSWGGSDLVWELDNILGCELLKEGKRILREVCARDTLKRTMARPTQGYEIL